MHLICILRKMHTICIYIPCLHPASHRMHLTRHTDYAIRTLIYLGVSDTEERIQIRQVCEAFNLPINHLSKVVNKLARLGYIDSRRGRGGGILLGKPPAQIHIGELVRAMEPTLTPINCFEPRCALLPDCRFKGILALASDAFIHTIDAYTLEDLLDSDRQPLQLENR